MKKITIIIITIFLIALVVLSGCSKAEPTGGEGQGSRPAEKQTDSANSLEEEVDESELDDITVDDSLF